jgi:D-psicose/D-tagatose/L-ribulose 3-epimerase
VEKMKMKLGVHSLFWCLEFNEKELHLIDKVSEMGFDAIELAPWDGFRTLDPELVRKRVDEAGLEISGLSMTLNNSNDISSTDKSIRQSGIDLIRDYSAWGKALGCNLIAGPIYSECGKARPIPADERKAEWERAVNSLKTIADDLEKKEFILAIEPLNRFETDMVNTAEQACTMCEQVGSPWVKVTLDTFHMNIEEKDIGVAIIASKKYLAHMHTCANDRGVPGEDHIPWYEIKKALMKINYNGYGVIESFAQEEVGPFANIWRPLTEKQEYIASKGIKFLRKVFG